MNDLIVFEGVDCSGKSTQIKLLGEKLSKNNISYSIYREPGGNSLSEKIRDILLDKSIHIGDILMVGEHYGVVTLIRSRYTVLRKLDGIEVIIPNETLISENIINHTLSDRKSRISIDVQISYKSSVDKAFEIMLNAAKNESRVLNDPEPTVFLMKFADSGIDLMLSFYILDPEEGSWGLKSDIYREI